MRTRKTKGGKTVEVVVTYAMSRAIARAIRPQGQTGGVWTLRLAMTRGFGD